MRAPFKSYLLNGRPFSEKREVLVRGKHSLHISRQKEGANSREVLFGAETIFWVNTVYSLEYNYFEKDLNYLYLWITAL